MRPLSARQALLRIQGLARGIRALQESMRRERDSSRRDSILESMVHDTKILQRLIESQVG